MIKKLQLILIFSLIYGLAFSPQFVNAQEDDILIGEGNLIPDIEDVDIAYLIDDFLVLEFSSSGGMVTGSGYVHWAALSMGSYNDFTFSGELNCGDNGKIGGKVVENVYTYNTQTETLNESEFYYSAESIWSGQLYANGSGQGVILSDGEVYANWEITFSPENFCPEAQPVSPEVAADVEISHEYIYTTYGINVWDSFGDDGYDRAVWSPQELTWLNDVLKELPPELMDRMTVNRIVRNTVNIDDNGNPKPSTFGSYLACDRSVDPHCDGSSATIRIFDTAGSPFDFLNDPDGEKQFKATILHEMVHAMQYHKDQHSIYRNANHSPLVENYIDATKKITDMDHADYEDWNGWDWYQGRWYYANESENQPPTSYGLKNPREDMAESVMMYVYDPERLKNSSYERYYFIRDEMFGGVEYEDGVQKKP